jgi:predicted DNA-binding transcriptional regulator AlpA
VPVQGNVGFNSTTMPKSYEHIGCVDREPCEGLGLLLLTARQAASACGRSLRAWRSWDSGGRIPRPVRIGRSTLWRADELHEWVAAGCPRREQWESRTC